jgi:hypothetical protein
MLALCLNQISAERAAKTNATPFSPIATSAIGETSVAAKAAADE